MIHGAVDLSGFSATSRSAWAPISTIQSSCRAPYGNNVTLNCVIVDKDVISTTTGS
jgi:hypothetical protein